MRNWRCCCRVATRQTRALLRKAQGASLEAIVRVYVRVWWRESGSAGRTWSIGTCLVYEVSTKRRSDWLSAFSPRPHHYLHEFTLGPHSPRLYRTQLYSTTLYHHNFISCDTQARYRKRILKNDEVFDTFSNKLVLFLPNDHVSLSLSSSPPSVHNIADSAFSQPSIAD